MSIKFSTRPASRVSGAIIGGILGFILGPIIINPITALIKNFTRPKYSMSEKILWIIPSLIVGALFFFLSPLIYMYLLAKTGATRGLLAVLEKIFIYTPQEIFNFNIAERKAANAIEEISKQSLQEDAVHLWNNFKFIEEIKNVVFEDKDLLFKNR